MNSLEIISSVEIGLIYGIVAIGIFLTFRVINFPDMTCDGSFVLGAAISGSMIKFGCNPWLSLIVAFFGGAIAGLATGIIHTVFKVSDLLSGILMAFMLYSINIRVMGGIPNIAILNETTMFSFRNPIVILGAMAIILSVVFCWLFSTDFGLGIRSVGQSKSVAVNYGVNIKSMTLIVLMLSNAMISLGGAVFNQHQCFADVSQGVGTLIIGLAAVMIGEKLFHSRSFFVLIPACIIGSVVYRMFIGLALHSEFIGLKTQDLNLITGLLIIVIMVMPRVRGKVC